MDIQHISSEQRKQLLKNHPVITKNYSIITPIILNAYALIRDRVYMRSTGTFLYATPRMGKTTCARVVKTSLESEFPLLFIMSFIAESHRKQDSGMLIDILASDKLDVPRSIRFKDLQLMLMRHIATKLSERDGNQFVLIIDEMQNLSELELSMLATIHNRLEPLGIKMTTIGFGQPEILTLRSALQATGKDFLIARFLSEPIHFDGCVSQNDLETILKAYDVREYPEESGYTFTSFFLPAAYGNGFRLSSFAKPIWNALMKVTIDDSVPMEHLTRTIEYLLVAGSKKDAKNYVLTPGIISTAVEGSNLQYFTGLMRKPHQE